MMRRAIAVIMSILGLVFFSACSEGARHPWDSRGQRFSEEYQVKNHADGEISAFGLNIAPADEMGDWVVEWVSEVTDGKGFQYFIYSDPDSWDVYLYYPEEQAETQWLTNDGVAVEYSDSTLGVYVTTRHEAGVTTEEEGAMEDIIEDTIEDVMEDATKDGGRKWILHFAAPMFGAWPSEIKLYWDGREISCDACRVE